MILPWVVKILSDQVALQSRLSTLCYVNRHEDEYFGIALFGKQHLCFPASCLSQRQVMRRACYTHSLAVSAGCFFRYTAINDILSIFLTTTGFRYLLRRVILAPGNGKHTGRIATVGWQCKKMLLCSSTRSPRIYPFSLRLNQGQQLR